MGGLCPGFVGGPKGLKIPNPTDLHEGLMKLWAPDSPCPLLHGRPQTLCLPGLPKRVGRPFLFPCTWKMVQKDRMEILLEFMDVVKHD